MLAVKINFTLINVRVIKRYIIKALGKIPNMKIRQ